jgi:hypothetical protein
MIESQFNFQHAFPRSVVVIYDPLRTTHGALNLSAIRLTDKFFNMFKKGEFTKDSYVNPRLDDWPHSLVGLFVTREPAELSPIPRSSLSEKPGRYLLNTSHSSP